MRWIICGLVGLWAQGTELLRDSLIVENERIEYLELGLKPHAPPPSFKVPNWEVRWVPSWEKSPTLDTVKAEIPTAGRPTWARLDPLHLRYSIGRFWSQEVQLLWNKTRHLLADAGFCFRHHSNLQAYVPQARSGITSLSGWAGSYTTRRALEGRYQASYEKYRLYAPYAERWEGYNLETPLPDSLRKTFLRQQLEITLHMPNLVKRIRYQSARIDFHTGVPEWIHTIHFEIKPPLPFKGEGTIQGEVFWDGQRYSMAARPMYHYSEATFSLKAGIQASYAQAGRGTLLLSPVGEVIYLRWSERLRPFLRAEANLIPLTYFAQVARNPYLHRERKDLPFERSWTVSEVGFKGQGPGWEYQTAIEYALREGVPLFVPEGAAFRIDTLRRLRSIGLVGRLLYLPAPTGIYTELRFAARQWRLRSRYPAFYGEAPLEGALRLGYRFQEKWHGWAALSLLGPRTLDSQTRAPAYVDISWRIEYQIFPILSFFAEMQNLLNQRFYRWRGYQERPLNFSMGIWSKIG